MIYLDTPVTIIDDGTDRSIGIKFSEPDAGDEQIISGVYFRSSHDTKTELNATWYPDKGTLIVDIPNNLINYSGYAKLIIPKTSFLTDAITMKLHVYSPKDTDGVTRAYYGQDKYAFVRDFDTTSNQIFIEVATDIVNTDFIRSLIDKIVSEKGVLDQAGTAVDTDTLKNDILNRVTELINVKKIQEEIKKSLTDSIEQLKTEQSKSLQNQESRLEAINTKVSALDAKTIKTDILSSLDEKIIASKIDIINTVDTTQLKMDLTTLVTETSKSDIAAAKEYTKKYLTTYFEGSDFTTKITTAISDTLSTINSDISSTRTVAYGAKSDVDNLKTKVEKNATDIAALEEFKTSVSGAIASYITDNLTSQKIIETLKTNSDYIDDIFTDMTSLLDAKYIKKADVTKVDTMEGTKVTVGETEFTIPVTDSFAKETDLGTLRAKVGSVESSIGTAIDTKLANGGDHYIKNSELHTALQGLSGTPSRNNGDRKPPTSFCILFDKDQDMYYIYFDNDSELRFYDYKKVNTVYGIGYPQNINFKDPTEWPIPGNIIAASRRTITIEAYAKKPSETYWADNTTVINPVVTPENSGYDADFSNAILNPDSRSRHKSRQKNIIRVMYELGIWTREELSDPKYQVKFTKRG